MPEGDATLATCQELAKVREELGKEIAEFREELGEAIAGLREEIRGARSEFRWLFGLLLATLIGGSAILLPIALDRVTAEIRAAASEVVRSLEGDVRYLESRIDATD